MGAVMEDGGWFCAMAGTTRGQARWGPGTFVSALRKEMLGGGLGPLLVLMFRKSGRVRGLGQV